MLDRHCTTDPHPQPSHVFFFFHMVLWEGHALSRDPDLCPLYSLLCKAGPQCLPDVPSLLLLLEPPLQPSVNFDDYLRPEPHC
jgi:hypothetical protein